MRTLILAALAASTVFVTSASAQRYVGSGGPGDGPYWAGGRPGSHRGIWRYGYYQGNDPDTFIRGQIMRDPTNLPGINR